MADQSGRCHPTELFLCYETITVLVKQSKQEMLDCPDIVVVIVIVISMEPSQFLSNNLKPKGWQASKLR